MEQRETCAVGLCSFVVCYDMSLVVETQTNDDVIKWRRFPRYWPCAGNSPVTGEFPAQKLVTRTPETTAE